ncbi:hypothetical protein ACFV9E_09010 [Streptomyces sp. NPDC059835]|uniref:hypothetical protein n=1 Tax=Streptomyces sp. NPDC059835 TaxID=3346967 RepID=UPI00365DD57B
MDTDDRKTLKGAALIVAGVLAVGLTSSLVEAWNSLPATSGYVTPMAQYGRDGDLGRLCTSDPYARPCDGLRAIQEGR